MERNRKNKDSNRNISLVRRRCHTMELRDTVGVVIQVVVWSRLLISMRRGSRCVRKTCCVYDVAKRKERVIHIGSSFLLPFK